jgi:hypothetical protein
MKPHKHAELIKAWADGAEIECRDCRVWYYAKDPRWQEDMEYRIKPKTKPDIEKFFLLESNPILGLRLNEISGFQKQPHEDWIRIVFDGETAKMKSAEIL